MVILFAALIALISLTPASATVSEPPVGVNQASQGSEKTRQITASPNVPLANRLVPGDELVLVAPAGIRSRFRSSENPTLAEDLDEHSESDVIAIAEATMSESFLTDDGSWIRTRVTFRPIRIIKGNGVATSGRSTLSLYHDGGEVRIKGVRVRAGYFYLYEPGARYLIFLRSFGGDNNAPGKMQYRIDAQDHLAPMPMSNGRFVSAPGAFYGLSVSAVIQGLSERLTRNDVYSCVVRNFQSAPASSNVRTIVAQHNVPIASQLRPDDRFVLVERSRFEIFVDNTLPALPVELDRRARVSDVIAVGELVTSDALLVDSESWIRTKRIFRPLRVIKDARKVISETSPLLTVYHDGGESQINGVTVRVGEYYAYETKQRYLLFLRSFSKDNNALVGVQLAIDAKDTIVPMRLSDGRTFPDTSRIHGMSLEFVIREMTRRLGANAPQQ